MPSCSYTGRVRAFSLSIRLSVSSPQSMHTVISACIARHARSQGLE